eukprot:5466997-Prymnesium_polylepis.1
MRTLTSQPPLSPRRAPRRHAARRRLRPFLIWALPNMGPSSYGHSSYGPFLIWALAGMLLDGGCDLERAACECAQAAGFVEEPTLRMLKPRWGAEAAVGGDVPPSSSSSSVVSDDNSEPIFVFRKPASAAAAAAICVTTGAAAGAALGVAVGGSAPAVAARVSGSDARAHVAATAEARAAPSKLEDLLADF